ncbi:MAG: hypothetical protein ACP5SH_07850, partial [Syntrophobacteraceae bacterium]
VAETTLSLCIRSYTKRNDQSDGKTRYNQFRLCFHLFLLISYSFSHLLPLLLTEDAPSTLPHAFHGNLASPISKDSCSLGMRQRKGVAIFSPSKHSGIRKENSDGDAKMWELPVSDEV